MAVPMKIYVASSWRNAQQQDVVAALRALGHDVYDFKNPPNASGFSWSEIDPAWKSWTAEAFLKGLDDPRADEGFQSDMDALMGADACVLVLPCGRSAHLELGYAVGAGKRTIVLLDNPISEPELMYKMCTEIVTDMDGLREAVSPTRHRAEQLLDELQDKFAWMEERGVRVGTIFLHPAEAVLLPGHEVFDAVDPVLRAASPPGLIGNLWGAQVFESDKVPSRHVGVFSDDAQVELLGGAGCMPL